MKFFHQIILFSIFVTNMNWDDSVLQAKMEKASKWFSYILSGKKKFRYRSYTSFSMRIKSPKMESQYCTPKVKGKWSFRRLAGKISGSLDAIKAKFTLQASQNHANALVVTRGDIENIAATKIQAAFRSFLARKALHALRGLVKLQALVRGWIVRRQTELALTQMNALISIQLKARIRRIQKAEETQLNVRSHSTMDDWSVRYHDRMPMNMVSKSSVHLSVLERFDFKDYSAKIEISPQTYSVAHMPNPTKVSLARQQPCYPKPWSNGCPLLPNYMTNTVSSRAKRRSHSMQSKYTQSHSRY